MTAKAYLYIWFTPLLAELAAPLFRPTVTLHTTEPSFRRSMSEQHQRETPPIHGHLSVTSVYQQHAYGELPEATWCQKLKEFLRLTRPEATWCAENNQHRMLPILGGWPQGPYQA